MPAERRVAVAFVVAFSNGGGIQGQGFRLDIEGDDITDDELAARIIRELRLLMVESVRIVNKTIIEEPHKRREAAVADIGEAVTRIDLSHVIESGMITYKGLPAPLICDYLSREASRSVYSAGTEFQIDRIEMVGNTGTYLDTPYHRFADGHDLADLPLERVADCEGMVIDVTGASGRVIDWQALAAGEVRGKAVLVRTGWDRHWRTDRYFENHPHLTEAAAEYLRDQGALLVGIDSLNVAATAGGEPPAPPGLLRAGIPSVEHRTGRERLPADGFRFAAGPPKVRRMGTFPVRAHAIGARRDPG